MDALNPNLYAAIYNHVLPFIKEYPTIHQIIFATERRGESEERRERENNTEIQSETESYETEIET